MLMREVEPSEMYHEERETRRLESEGRRNWVRLVGLRSRLPWYYWIMIDDDAMNDDSREIEGHGCQT